MRFNEKRTRRAAFAVGVIGLIAVFFMGWWAGINATKVEAHRGKLLREGQFHLINPLLACEIGEKDVFTELKPIEHAVINSLSKEKEQGLLDKGAVYLRFLNSGRWIGVNEKEQFTPASLLKVLLMMAYFKKAESAPALLDEPILYTREVDSLEQEDVTLQKRLTIGKAYTVKELVYHMVTTSSNAVMRVLLSHIDTHDLEEVFADLRLPPPSIDNSEGVGFMSVEDYSIALRVLYSATYLNRAMSELALEFLSESTFREGFVAGLPPGVTIAHKFGSYLVPSTPHSNNEKQELHECGIVYYPDHPYLLCVMTRGTSYAELEKALADISQLTYQEVNRFFKKN